MRWAHANSIGIRRFGFGGASGGGGGDPVIDPPSTEIVSLPGSSATYDITTIDGVAIGNFTVVMGVLKDMATTGSPTELGLRISDDGGTTFDTTSSFYTNFWVAGSEISNPASDTKLLMHDGIAASGNELVFIIRDLGSAFPVTSLAGELNTVTANGKKSWRGYHAELLVVDAIQLVVTGGASPTMSSGSLHLMGMR